MDKIDLGNGIVYMINAYPRYFEKSIYMLMKENTVTGLSQNLKSVISSFKLSSSIALEYISSFLKAFGLREQTKRLKWPMKT